MWRNASATSTCAFGTGLAHSGAIGAALRPGDRGGPQHGGGLPPAAAYARGDTGGADGRVPSPEEEVLRRERAAQLRRAVDALSNNERLLFYRKYYYLQSTAQIAAELGLTERAVEGRLYRLRGRLRRLMGGDAL